MEIVLFLACVTCGFYGIGNIISKILVIKFGMEKDVNLVHCQSNRRTGGGGISAFCSSIKVLPTNLLIKKKKIL